MQSVERTAHNRQQCWKAGEPEGATPASDEIMHRLWRCLLLAERVLSAAKWGRGGAVVMAFLVSVLKGGAGRGGRW